MLDTLNCELHITNRNQTWKISVYDSMISADCCTVFSSLLPGPGGWEWDATSDQSHTFQIWVSSTDMKHFSVSFNRVVVRPLETYDLWFSCYGDPASLRTTRSPRAGTDMQFLMTTWTRTLIPGSTSSRSTRWGRGSTSSSRTRAPSPRAGGSCASSTFATEF